MSENNNEDKKFLINTTLRSDRLKEIDALYKNQIKQIYTDSKSKNLIENKKSNVQIDKNQQKQVKSNFIAVKSQNTKSVSTLNVPQSSSNSKYFNEIDQKVRASTFLKGDSVRTIETLRKQNQSKQLKIRQLTNKCQALIQKLKNNLQPYQFQRQVQNLKEYSQNKMERLENLFKIKSEEIFFKIKLQIINLLQQFGVGKEEISQINQINNQGNLFLFMSKKLKHKLKDFRSKQQQSTFQIQKDKILSQKQQQRIHYLIETNELLRLSESKLKTKTEDLKNQLNEFLQKLKQKQKESEDLQSDVFQLKRQNEELNSINTKLSHTVKAVNHEKVDERRTWEAKEKEMKNLLNNYFVEKKKLQADLQQSQGKIQEILIKQKFLQQENQRLNRDLVRWKQRYEWIEKENDVKMKEIQQQLNALSNNFDQYKTQHNQAVQIGHRSDIDQALRKVEEYQRAYQYVLLQLEQEKRLFARAEEQYDEKLQNAQRQWLERVKRLQKIRQEELFQFQNDHQLRQMEIRQQFQKKEKLFAQQMQAHMRALLAEKDKKNTEKLVQIQAQNDELRREIQNLKEYLKAKQDFISTIRQHSK